MSPFRRVASHELRDLWRQPGTALLAAATVVLLAAAVAAAVPPHRAAEARKAEGARRVREQWLGQGERHPHSAAHYGIQAFRALDAAAVIEPGVSAVVGQMVPLVTHERAFPRHPAADDRTSAARYAPVSPALLGLTLLPFVIIVAGHRAIVGEREGGNLGLLMASGVHPRTLVAGKAAALAVVAVLLIMAKTGVDAAGVRAAEAAPHWGRLVGLELTHALYLLVWVCVTVGVSARAKTSQAALALLLSLWAVNTVIVPRVAATVGRLMQREPSLDEFRAGIARDITYLPDGSSWAETWSPKLVNDTLARYGVSSIEALPVGYAGIMLKSSDAHYEEVFARHFSDLDRLHARQSTWFHLVSISGPLVAAQSLGQAFAGTDLAHTQRFAVEAEAYRRLIVERTNDAIETGTTGTGWDLRVGRDFWMALPAFAPAPPSVAELAAAHRTSLGVLAAWLIGSAAWCARGARRIRP